MVSRPSIGQIDRDHIEDLGLVDDDRTPDMRKPPAATEGSQMNTHHTVTREEVL